ncbi:hypothetical protein PROVRUST_05630 [Providencia rustigianii DSM 4541]|uniref:Uncharacterized protein n=1 Tax=Providencia rustigianii DSM 4541 TaxID=500637 RepID=D1P0C0_9GAMM|nr:hypothetical protein PROVRUST_05630 [Providencia rustigianii DSM 4541]
MRFIKVLLRRYGIFYRCHEKKFIFIIKWSKNLLSMRNNL